MIYIHLSVINFRTFSKGMACKAVADRCRPSSSAATWADGGTVNMPGAKLLQILVLFRNFKVNTWTYMKFWSSCFNDCYIVLFCHTSFCFAPICRKNPRGRERIVFQALSCSGAFLLGSTLPIPPINSPSTRCLFLPTTPPKNSVNSSEKSHNGYSLESSCWFVVAFFLQMIFPTC